MLGGGLGSTATTSLWQPCRPVRVVVTSTSLDAGVLVEAFFIFLEDQPADLEVQLLGVGEEIDVAQRLILPR